MMNKFNPHKNGKHPGWSHINGNKDKRSYPEKFFLNCINGKLKVTEKYTFGKYFYDFAILDKKIDIEIDGEQHYRSEKSINYDKIRDKFSNDNGWLVYRISWIELRTNPNKTINDLLKWLKTKNVKNRIYEIPPEKISRIKYGTRKDYWSIRKENKFLKYKNTINILKNSNINFENYGWVNEASKVIGISPQNVNRWMKEFMSEFYKEKCFKRKISI